MRAAALRLGLLLGAALAATASAEVTPPDAPEIRDIEIQGATAFDRDAVLRIIRLKPGDKLRREAAAVASALETRYRIAGYPAARVAGSFDPETGVLTLAVDEGRLAEVVIEGLSGKAAARARQELELELGDVLKEPSIFDSLDRLERASEGAVRPRGEPPFTVEPTPQGARLTLQLESRRAQVAFRPGGPGVAGLYNRVDGIAPWAGVEATLHDRVSFNHASLYAAGGYGFAAERAGYLLGVRRSFGREHRLNLGYELHDFTDSDDVFRARGLEQGDTLVFSFTTSQDFHRRRGHEAYAFARLGKRAHLGLSVRSDTFSSLPVTSDGHLFSSAEPRPNPPVEEGLMRSALATLRFASRGGLFKGAFSERRSFLVRNPYGTPFEPLHVWRLDATLEAARPDLLGGSFSFTRFIAHLRRHHGISARQSLVARGLLGLSAGDLPPQKRFALGGPGTLRGYDLKEFIGERMALATVEWTFFPRSPFPRLVLFYDGGLTWGERGEGSGFKNDLGFGAQWRTSGSYLRVDVAFALEPSAGAKRARVTGYLRAPF